MQRIDYQDALENKTKLSSVSRKKLLNWLSRQNIEIQVEVFKEQKNQFFKLQQTIKIVEILPLVAFYLAIEKYYQKEDVENKKNKTLNLDSLDGISNFSIMKYQKNKIKIKREKLLNIWSVLQKLKKENFSTREISVFIKQKHRIDVSHSYIQQIWKEIEDV